MKKNSNVLALAMVSNSKHGEKLKLIAVGHYSIKRKMPYISQEQFESVPGYRFVYIKPNLLSRYHNQISGFPEIPTISFTSRQAFCVHFTDLEGRAMQRAGTTIVLEDNTMAEGGAA